jgi:acyl-CoA synthetase (AMP-forming)/AMP-acid ligase II
LQADGLTLIDLLRRASGCTEAGLRLLDHSETESWFSWADLYQRAETTCGGLQRLGLRAGDRVALIFPTCVEFFDAFFGILLAGAIPVPLYPPVRLGRLDEYLKRTSRMLSAVSPRLVLSDGRALRLVGTALRGSALELGCRCPSEIPTETGRPAAKSASDIALIQFSSGTTIDPKPVALSHRAVAAQAAALNAHWPDVDDQVHSGVSWLPLYHDMGLVGCVITALERPGSMTLIPPDTFLARPATWLRAISRYRATISVAPNFGYGLCVEKIRDEDLKDVDLSCWIIGLNGAEPVVARVMRRFQRRFEPWGLRPETLTPVYGLSEATLAVTFSHVDRPFTVRSFDRDSLSRNGRAVESPDGPEIVSVGRPIDGLEVRVVDSENRNLGAAQVGRLLIRGPSVMEGYFGRPEASDEVFIDGWLDTGDLGFLYRGELYLTGRAKDVLMIRGRSHSPSEVEEALDRVEGVRTGCSAAVSWLPDGSDGEELLLLVEAMRGTQEDGYREIAKRCRDAVRAATGLSADTVEVLSPGTLPRTSSGKLRRQEALRRHLDGELTPPRRVTAFHLARRAVRSSFELARVRRNGRS